MLNVQLDIAMLFGIDLLGCFRKDLYNSKNADKHVSGLWKLQEVKYWLKPVYDSFDLTEVLCGNDTFGNDSKNNKISLAFQ